MSRRRHLVRRGLVAGSVAGAFAVGLAACAEPTGTGASASATPDGTPTSTTAGPDTGTDVPGFVTVTRQGGGVAESMTALLEGTLALRDGCVVVESGASVSLPAFPEAAQWANDRMTLGTDNWAIGDPVSFGGGFVPVAGFGSADGSSLVIPAACEGYADVFVVG